MTSSATVTDKPEPSPAQIRAAVLIAQRREIDLELARLFIEIQRGYDVRQHNDGTTE